MVKSKWNSAVFASFLFSSAAGLAADNYSKVYTPSGLTSVVVVSAAGDVDVSKSNDATASILAKKLDFGSGCKLKTKVTDKLIELRVEESSWSNCEVDFELKIPSTASLEVKLGSGDVDIAGLQGGKLRVKSGSGNVRMDADFADAEVASGSGNISANGLRRGAQIKVGSGNIEARYLVAPKQGKLELKSGSGNATVYLPASAKIRSDLKAGFGRVSNEFAQSSEAFLISMRAGSGNLSIRKIAH